MDAARVAQQSTCSNGGGFVRRLQLSNNAIHKYARTMAICQRGFFLGCEESKWSSTSLTPEEKMHEHTCIYHHLAFSIWTIQKSLSLVSAERPIFPRSNTSYSKQVNWIKLWEVPSQYRFTAVYSNRRLRWIQSKTGTNLLVQNPRSSQAPEAKRVCRALNAAK